MLNLVPYVEINGSRSIPDSVMVSIWRRMSEAGINKMVFFSNAVSTEEQWLVMVKRPSNVLHVIFDDDLPVWVSWLNEFGYNFASGHFFALPEAWGEKTDRLAEMTLRHWFGFSRGDKPLIDVIIGKIPAHNKIACNFIERIGFTKLGVIPSIAFGEGDHQKVGCVLFYLHRSEVI